MTSFKAIYYPIIYKVPNIKNSIIDTEVKAVLYDSLPYPHFKLGFHHYIHSNREKLSILNEKEVTEKKKDFYYVANPFEYIITDYDKSISDMAKTYFEDSKLIIENQDFFELWEMIIMFNLIPTNTNGFISCHLSTDSNDSFILAPQLFRNKFIEKKNTTKGDKYLKGEGKKAQLVTANGFMNSTSINTEEQESFKILLGQIISCLKSQEVGGNFVMKIYESFTPLSLKLICLLKELYEDLYIYKPLTSKESNAEKYIVCKNLKYEEKKTKKLVEALDEVYKESIKSSKYLNDIFPHYEIDNEMYMLAIAFNTEISNKEFVAINKIVTYIKENNYRGDKYQKYRNDQINAANYWSSLFYPSSKKELDTIKGFLDELIIKVTKNDEKRIKVFTDTVRL